MNVLKAKFTRWFVIWLELMVLYASIQIIRGIDPLLSWIGLDLTALSLLPFFISRMKGDATVSRKHTLAYTLVSGLGLVICMTVSYRYQQAAGIIHIWAGVTFVVWVVYLRFILER